MPYNNIMSKKTRIDQLMVEKGLVQSRSQAQRLVMAGQVRVDGQVVPKTSSRYSFQEIITIDEGPRFVSRGGDKLEAAFEVFSLDVSGKVCADVGSSTGGFTDCLLQHDAQRVYAIDVGKGLLDWKLRNHPKVVVIEGTNARYLDELPEPVSFIAVDVSFISLKKILPVIKNWFPNTKNTDDNGGIRERLEALVLIKPQFEAGRKIAAKGKGVIRDPEIHRKVLFEVLSFALEINFNIQGLAKSPVIGPKGNVEFLAWLSKDIGKETPIYSLSEWITDIVPLIDG